MRPRCSVLIGVGFSDCFETVEMTNSEPSAIVLQCIPCMFGLYKKPQPNVRAHGPDLVVWLLPCRTSMSPLWPGTASCRQLPRWLPAPPQTAATRHPWEGLFGNVVRSRQIGFSFQVKLR